MAAIIAQAAKAEDPGSDGQQPASYQGQPVAMA